MRGRPDIGIVAGTDSNKYCTYIQLGTGKGSIRSCRTKEYSICIDFWLGITVLAVFAAGGSAAM
jgi:hypothetical protein